jgi:hypothetical protein
VRGLGLLTLLYSNIKYLYLCAKLLYCFTNHHYHYHWIVCSFADDSTEEEEQDADCVLCTGCFSEDHNVEEWIRCAKYFRWAHTLCAGMEEDFVCEPSQG